MTAREAVAANPAWYHTIELAPGVVTPGQIDHRAVVSRVLPADLRGKRALDVGTFDGFWAFELERRGAEVVAIDVGAVDDAQWPPLQRERLKARAADWGIEVGRGFALASEALGSKAQRVVKSVLEVSPQDVGGEVDLVFMGALMLHLRDPVLALERLHGVLKPGGTLLQMEGFGLATTLLAPRRPVGWFLANTTEFNWWYPNLSCLKAWPWAAGFTDVRLCRVVRPRAVRSMRGWQAVIESRRP
jgi:SAM-dependent methyltransferase